MGWGYFCPYKNNRACVSKSIKYVQNSTSQQIVMAYLEIGDTSPNSDNCNGIYPINQDKMNPTN
jgi:hypothetical protein